MAAEAEAAARMEEVKRLAAEYGAMCGVDTYMAYVDSIRADGSELNRLITTVWDGLRDRHVVAALRARSLVDVVFTTPMVFFMHHRLVTRPMVRTIMNAAQAFI